MSLTQNFCQPHKFFYLYINTDTWNDDLHFLKHIQNGRLYILKGSNTILTLHSILYYLPTATLRTIKLRSNYKEIEIHFSACTCIASYSCQYLFIYIERLRSSYGYNILLPDPKMNTIIA